MADKTTFDILNAVNVNEHTEVKDTGKTRLTYLSWAWAWAEVKKRFPNASYEIVKFEGLPYVFDEKTGYMVYTTVTIDGITHEMWLPVMDANNRAMLDHPYEVQTKYSKFTVQSATMFDINKTIMRCLTKNLAMFGLGLYIYAGEDLPDESGNSPVEAPAPAKKTNSRAKAEKAVEAKIEPNQMTARAKLKEFCTTNKINTQVIIKACGLNPNSTEEDYEKAYNYALLKLASESNLPFEVV